MAYGECYCAASAAYSSPSVNWNGLATLSLMPRPRPANTLFPYTTLFRSLGAQERDDALRSGIHPKRSVRVRREQVARSEEHTSELQSHSDLVCRLLLEKKSLSCSTSGTGTTLSILT